MASTRNNNTPGNYCLQQQQYSLARDYHNYKYSFTGRAYSTKMPCIGITPSHMPRDTLSTNPVEIETYLFGINSNNLVHPTAPINPKLNTIPEIPFFNRLPIIMPKPLVVENNQRPFPIP
jgi:hypothetical protein